MKSLFDILKKSQNTFDLKEENERIIVVLRRHPLPIVLRGFVAVVLSSVPFFVFPITASWLSYHELGEVFLFLSSVWLLLLWSGFFYAFTMYLLDVWIVSDRRIIDSNQHAFFMRTVAEMRLERVQDISVDIHGVIQTFFNFGNLEVQTAGTVEKFKFIQIPQPLVVKDLIMNAVEDGNQNKS